MFSKVLIIGRLTQEVSLRFTPKGTPVASFTLAVNHKYSQDGEKKEGVSFIDVVVFGKTAEFCGQYVTKGTAVIVDGRLSQRRWESEGQKRSKIEVIASTVDFLPGQKKREGGDESGGGEGEFVPPDEKTDLEPF